MKLIKISRTLNHIVLQVYRLSLIFSIWLSFITDHDLLTKISTWLK